MFNDNKKNNNAQINKEKALKPFLQNRQESNKEQESVDISKAEKKGGVEDILAETDAVNNKEREKPEIFQPKAGESADIANKQAEAVPASTGKAKKYLVLAAIIIILGLLGFAGYWAYGKFFKVKAADEFINEEIGGEENGQASEDKIITPQQPKPEQKKQKTAPTPIQPKDSDQDGLTDDEEKKLGTNINSIDSDNDGLFDREEVKVYKTDPLNPDTDNDGFLDGEEVKDGYNPKGAGRLYEVK